MTYEARSALVIRIDLYVWLQISYLPCISGTWRQARIGFGAMQHSQCSPPPHTGPLHATHSKGPSAKARSVSVRGWARARMRAMATCHTHRTPFRPCVGAWGDAGRKHAPVRVPSPDQHGMVRRDSVPATGCRKRLHHAKVAGGPPIVQGAEDVSGPHHVPPYGPLNCVVGARRAGACRKRQGVWDNLPGEFAGLPSVHVPSQTRQAAQN